MKIEETISDSETNVKRNLFKDHKHQTKYTFFKGLRGYWIYQIQVSRGPAEI